MGAAHWMGEVAEVDTQGRRVTGNWKLATSLDTPPFGFYNRYRRGCGQVVRQYLPKVPFVGSNPITRSSRQLSIV